MRHADDIKLLLRCYGESKLSAYITRSQSCDPRNDEWECDEAYEYYYRKTSQADRFESRILRLVERLEEEAWKYRELSK